MERDVKQVLNELINIPTYDGIKSGHPIISYLEDAFSSCCEVLKLEDELNNTHFLIGVNTHLNNISNAFMFSGHIDTVPETENHKALASFRNGYIEGLGSADMKGFVASLICNIKNFQRSHKPIIISLTSDEETDFYGIETVLSEMKKRNIALSAAIVGEPTSSNIALSHRGNSIFVGKIIGKACHSSTPEQGINAINLSMEAISDIESCIVKHRNNASICITNINGGKACNVVPDECKTTISVRAKNYNSLNEVAYDLNEIYKKVGEKAVKYEINNVFNIPPFECSGVLMRELFSSKNNIPFNCASEAGFIQGVYENADIAIYGPGDNNCIHREGERMDIVELTNYSSSLPKVVERYYNLQKERDCLHEPQL